MTVRFIHTADWQAGKPFAGIEDPDKRALVRNERIATIDRIGAAASAHGAEFILVAGDLFDTPTATKSTVSSVCSAIGKLGVPVIAIPGNHDHGGPASIWEQDFFRRECASLSPNFRVLLKSEPVVLESVVVFPCPLARRAESADPTAWLRSVDFADESFGDRARVVLAHGSVQGFGGRDVDEEASEAGVANQIDLSRIPDGEFDYIALGDWHGTKRVAEKAWYSGTPEIDRFPKGETNDPGHVLAVAAARGKAPDVAPVSTARFGWHRIAFDFADDAALARLRERVEAAIGTRAQGDLLRLDLTGALGIGATTELEHFLETLDSRLLRMKLSNGAVVAPTAEECEALTRRPGDPLLSRVATHLAEIAEGGDEAAAIARTAMRELHAACVGR